MLTKVTLRRLQPGQILFFKGPEACVIMSGQLHILSHEEDLADPYICATYNPGDIIGLNIDNGWHNAQHSWICAWQQCDVLMISKNYLEYLWDMQKRFKSNLIADLLNETPQISELSEQTLFTIANDICEFRDYTSEEIICKQDNFSKYNLLYQQQERAAITSLAD